VIEDLLQQHHFKLLIEQAKLKFDINSLHTSILSKLQTFSPVFKTYSLSFLENLHSQDTQRNEKN